MASLEHKEGSGEGLFLRRIGALSNWPQRMGIEPMPHKQVTAGGEALYGGG